MSSPSPTSPTSPTGSGPSSSSRERTVPRYTFVAVTKVIESASQACIVGRTGELSSKGCYVDTLNPLPPGTIVNLVISRDRGSFATRGKVIYIHEGIGMGVLFLDMDPDQTKILSDWLAECTPNEAL